MKSIFSFTISPDLFWEFSYLCLAVYLLFHPALAFPQSNAVVLGGGLALVLFRTIPRDSFEKLGIFWTLFLFYNLISAFWSFSPGLTLHSSGFLFLGTLLIVMAQQNSLASKNRIEIILLILALTASVLGVYQWLFGFDQVAQASSHLTGEDANIIAAAVHNKRAFGPLVTPGALAAFLIFSIPQALVRCWTSSGFKKILFGGITLVLLLALAATGGVGAWICLAIALGFLFYKQNTDPRAFFILGLLFLAALGLVWHRGFHSWTLASFSMRIDLWQAAWHLFLQHPVIGWGLGTFGEAYQSAGLPLGTGALFAHNLFLQLLVETGLLGTLLAVLAIGSWVSRFKWPSRWEGWGVLGGVLAVFLFSLIDLPFQMAELVWIFAGVAGRLELRSEPSWNWPKVLPKCIPVALLAVLAVTGFWPPYRPWNFCLLAVCLWTVFALLEGQIEKMKICIVTGAVYLAIRAFNSPSASGAVWFLELTGLLLLFYFAAPKIRKFEKFKMVFGGLGLLWAVKLVWYCWKDAPPPGMDWIKFQLVDVTPWVFYPNPKYLGIFLIPFIFFLVQKPFRNGLKTILLLLSLLIIFRLKALSALVGLGAGWLWNQKKDWRKLLIAALVVITVLVTFRFFNSSSTKWERFGIWESAVKVWSESPIFGVGPGVFAGEYHRVQAPRLDGVNRYLMDAVYAHNEFLDLLAAFGLVGFVFVFVLIFQIFLKLKKEENKNILIGLGAASFFDFCLHAPLTALLGLSCTVEEEKPARDLSCAGGLLVFGLALGLFGSPVFCPILKEKADAYAAAGYYPEAFRCWKQAVFLNSWDAELVQGESNFYEQLYRMTKDEAWRKKADESLEQVVNLEKADGRLILERAKRWTGRYEANLGKYSFLAASENWSMAEKALPFDTFVYFEEGHFWLKAAQLSGRKLWAIMDYGQKVENCYSMAVRLEPNFAAAWVNLGICQAQKPKASGEPENEADFDFKQALKVYDQWKDAPGLSPEEKQMVDLPSEEVKWLRKVVKP
jgi:O-antigen ligase